MKKIITAAIGGVAAAGLIVLASPNASAGPSANDLTLTQDEIAWADEHGKAEVCAVFGANPTADGFERVIYHVIDEGWEAMPAARIVGYSIGTYCLEHFGAMLEATKGLPG